MDLSPTVLSARSRRVTSSAPTRMAGRRVPLRRVHTPLWWRDACGAFVWCSMLVVVALWVAGGGVQGLAQVGAGLTSVGRLTGLVASDLLLIQVLLMARIPLVERAFGQDELARRHRWVGFSSFSLMVVHVVTITVGYAVASPKGLWAMIVDFVVNYPGMLLAVAGTVALVGVTVTSLRAARARLRYESWHLLHLYAYLGVGLALPHQLWTGKDFLTSRVATVYWWMLWVAAAASVLFWRVGQPLWRSLRHQLVVEQVHAENDRVTTVVMRGRMLHRLPVRAGQFLQWRFLDGPGFTRHTPTRCPRHQMAGPCGSLPHTWGMDRRGWRACVRGRRCSSKAPTAGCTGGLRTRRKVLLMASGIGITPMRALLKELDQRPGEVTVLYRTGSERDRILVDELTSLAGRRQAGLFVVTGHRVTQRSSWLPAHAAHLGDVEALLQLVPDVATHDVFICGSPGWMDATEQAVIGAGVPPEHVHIERFVY
jgi:predicted ferric reductase